LANVTLDGDHWRLFRPQLAEFLRGLPAEQIRQQSWEKAGLLQDQGLVIPAQINFVGKGVNLYKNGYELDGSYAVINNYLRTTWLWEKVRVQGGAYGGFCLFDHRSGVLTYLSYRDPNVVETLDIYDQTGGFLRQLDGTRLTQEELTKSIIGAIGDLDAYQFPDAKGFTSMARYLTGETDAMRQARREQILTTTMADFHTFGEALERANQAGRVVVLGSEQALQVANEQGRRLAIEKVL
jgi:Zn-dependent M16 (insulinase) family peptidase